MRNPWPDLTSTEHIGTRRLPLAVKVYILGFVVAMCVVVFLPEQSSIQGQNTSNDPDQSEPAELSILEMLRERNSATRVTTPSQSKPAEGSALERLRKMHSGDSTDPDQPVDGETDVNALIQTLKDITEELRE